MSARLSLRSLPQVDAHAQTFFSPVFHVRFQSRTQSPQPLWPAVGREERLWGIGILLPQDFCGKTIEAVT